ncbi:MAG: hypothetical protein OEV28_14310 [Nitrospirota bacterium]|nr:hypothetical protein [Nitrospirota bacterium]
MSNADTVKAIVANVGLILTGLGLKVEDASANPDLTTSAAAQILYESEQFENAFGQKPYYNTAGLVIKISFSDKAPATSRGKQVDWVHGLRDAITVNTLNVNALVASKLVSAALHNGAQVTYDAPVTTIDYKLDVRYREV